MNASKVMCKKVNTRLTIKYGICTKQRFQNIKNISMNCSLKRCLNEYIYTIKY